MYDSGISAKDFIDSLIEEADVSIEIPRASWLRWLNAVEQFAYSEILREYVAVKLDLTSYPSDTIPLSMIAVPVGCDTVIGDDIVRVYGEDGREMRECGVISSLEFPDKDTFFVDYKGNIVISAPIEHEYFTIVHRLRPIPKTSSNEAVMHVAFPAEYLDLAAAKMRGEAYKLANEDGIAAKWLNDYNAQLENFKVWAAERNERYGG